MSIDIDRMQIESASGGDAVPLTRLDTARSEIAHLWPQVIPGHGVLLFDIWTPNDDHEIVGMSLSDRSRTRVLGSAGRPRYLADGRLVYTRQGRLQVQAFSPDVMVAQEPAVPFLDAYKGLFTASTTGRTVYLPPVFDPASRRLMRVDRTGQGRLLAEFDNLVLEPQVSPDGTKVLVLLITDQGPGVYTYDLEGGQTERLARGVYPIWAPDGRSVAFNSGTGLYRLLVDGTADAELVHESGYPTSWSTNGALLISIQTDTSGWDVWVVDDVYGGGAARPLIVTEHSELAARFSPTGDWFAYQSDASGRTEVYVQPFSGQGRGQVVSAGGGRDPVWSRDGRELFYRADGAMWSVSISTNGELVHGVPRQLFTRRYAARASHQNYDYDPATDGFIMSPIESLVPDHFLVVINGQGDVANGSRGPR